jgi:hypothetical protein
MILATDRESGTPEHLNRDIAPAIDQGIVHPVLLNREKKILGTFHTWYT